MTAPCAPEDKRLPIFVLSPSQRCGCHWLHRLLLLHPDCRSGIPLIMRGSDGPEDHLLDNAHLLDVYARRVAWIGGFGNPDAVDGGPEAMLAALGDSLIRFIQEHQYPSDGQQHTVPVLVTPSARNLTRCRDVFGRAPIVLLVRDPRAVLRSAVRSFGGLPERYMRVWREGARLILDFLERDSGPHVLVRYEDLVGQPRQELTRILEMAGLDPGVYPYDKLSDIPVVGSSQLPGRVHWKPVARWAGFSPIVEPDPSEHRFRQSRLRWLLGPEADKLGYALGDRDGELSPAMRALTPVVQIACDLAWAAAATANRCYKASRGAEQLAW